MKMNTEHNNASYAMLARKFVLAAQFGKFEWMKELYHEYEKTHSNAEVLDFINAEDTDGNTALIHAAKKGHDEMVGFLLEHGANVLHLNQKHQNAARFASRCSNPEIIKALSFPEETDYKGSNSFVFLS